MPRKGSPLMSILNTISLESNKKIKINFNGGNLSSDGGLLLIKEFAAKVGLIKLVKKLFKTNDHTNSRIHTDSDNLMQMLYQIIAAYFEDDCADGLTNDPVLTSILEKEALASQPTLSRFWNRMDNDTLTQLDSINAKMRDIVYSIKAPEHMFFDLDSTLLNTYGKQEGEGFNFHYQAHGYHPLLCYDGITGDLLKAELRNGTQYCSNDADKFMIPLLQEYRAKYPSLPLYLRGDSGFASPDLYKACEDNDCKYAIRLKQNRTLIKYAAYADTALFGISMGAATVMNAVGKNLPSNVKTFIEDSGYVNLKVEFTYQLKKLFNLPSFPVIPAANTVTKIRAGYFFGDVDATKGLKETKLPALVLHGEEDGFVPLEHGKEAYNLITSEKEFHSFPGMKHVQAERKYREQYWKIIGEFLKKHFE